VIRALLMREVITGSDGTTSACLWLSASRCCSRSASRACGRQPDEPRLGLPIVAFAITGYSSVLMWRNSVGEPTAAIQQNFGCSITATCR
jgi:hypothetical protein